MFWVKQFCVMMPRWSKTKQNNFFKKKTNTFDCWCFSVVASKSSPVLPSPLDTLQVVADNSQEKLRHRALACFLPPFKPFVRTRVAFLHTACGSFDSHPTCLIKSVCDFFAFTGLLPEFASAVVSLLAIGAEVYSKNVS